MLSISLGANPLSAPRVNWKSPYALTGMFNTCVVSLNLTYYVFNSPECVPQTFLKNVSDP